MVGKTVTGEDRPTAAATCRGNSKLRFALRHKYCTLAGRAGPVAVNFYSFDVRLKQVGA